MSAALAWGAATTLLTLAVWWAALAVTRLDLASFSVLLVVPAGALLAGLGCAWGWYARLARQRRRPRLAAHLVAVLLALAAFGTMQRALAVRSGSATFAEFLAQRHALFWVGVRHPPRARQIDLRATAATHPGLARGLALFGWLSFFIEGLGFALGAYGGGLASTARQRPCPRCTHFFIDQRLLFFAAAPSAPEVLADAAAAMQRGLALAAWREAWRPRLRVQDGGQLSVVAWRCADHACDGGGISLRAAAGAEVGGVALNRSWLQQARALVGGKPRAT